MFYSNYWKQRAENKKQHSLNNAPVNASCSKVLYTPKRQESMSLLQATKQVQHKNKNLVLNYNRLTLTRRF